MDKHICKKGKKWIDKHTGVDLRKKINWPYGPVKLLNNWPLQNSTGLRNIGPHRYKRGDLPPPPQETGN